jgi:repressor LexA
LTFRVLFGIVNSAMPVTLYKRQREILDFISQFIQKHGISPTLQDIADAMNLSSLATVHEHLEILVKKGLIKRYQGAVRGIEVLDKKMSKVLEGVELSVIGFIAAGAPLEAIEDPTDTISVAPSMLSGEKRAFVLQVKGDSMIEEGILDGDYVVVEQQKTAIDGDIVIALLDNGLATLKRFFKESNKIRLEPANSTMSPIYARNVEIQGRVVGVIRRY